MPQFRRLGSLRASPEWTRTKGVVCVDVAQYQGASSLEERGQRGGEVRGAATAGGDVHVSYCEHLV